ncbi:MAG: N-acetyltransferase [Afipia sp.]|nr:N-acetyltransferase [Afipia sp.]
MLDLTIRPAMLDDLPAITAIYSHAVLTGTATFELDPPDLSEMMRRFEALKAGNSPYLVAILGAQIAGYAYAGSYRPRPAYRFTVEDSIYLAPESQQRGVGTALLRELIVQSEMRGYRQMIAVIGDSANAGSIALHARAGFHMVGTHPDVGFKFGRWLDSVLMQRALGKGASDFPKD